MNESPNATPAASRELDPRPRPSPPHCPACGGERPAMDPSGGGQELPQIQVPDREYGLERVTRFATCRHCHSCFQVPMPGESELGALYPSGYHSMEGPSLLSQIRHRMRWSRLLRLAPAARSVLDYGCGAGGFLLAAAELSPEHRFFGYEISERDEVEELADGRVTLFRGSSEFLFSQVPEIDLVTMNHVIEHLPDPRAIVASLGRKLRPKGLLEGQTPAAASLEQRVFGTRWSGYHAPRHTVVFARAGLESLLARCGFGEIELTPAFNPAGLAVSVASLLQGSSGGTIRRAGPLWLGALAAGALLAPIDLVCGRPAILDFAARRAGAPGA